MVRASLFGRFLAVYNKSYQKKVSKCFWTLQDEQNGYLLKTLFKIQHHIQSINDMAQPLAKKTIPINGYFN